MQVFNDEKGKRRQIIISNMQVSEVDEYYYSQFHREPKEIQAEYAKRLRKRIEDLSQKDDVSEWILGIHGIDGKLIGRMEIQSADSETASMKIEIPSRTKRYNYGVESIKQFCKICKENHYFKKIEMESNEITESYKTAYGIDNNIIEIIA